MAGAILSRSLTMGNGSPEVRRERGADDDVGVHFDAGERDGAAGATWLPKTAVLGPPL